MQRVGGNQGNDRDIDLIIVPSSPSAKLSTWKPDTAAGTWMNDLVQQNQRVQIWSYDYTFAGLQKKGLNMLKHWEHEHQAFCQAFHNLPLAPNGSTRVPVVFVAHSYGGFLLRKALIEERQRMGPEPLARLIKGIIFLSTPHITERDQDMYSKIGRRRLSNLMNIGFCWEEQVMFMNSPKYDYVEVIETSHEWERTMRLYCPVVVAFETVPTTAKWVKKGLFGEKDKSETDVFVDEDWARFGNQGLNVKLVGVPRSHMDMVKLTEGDPVWQALVAMLSS